MFGLTGIVTVILSVIVAVAAIVAAVVYGPKFVTAKCGRWKALSARFGLVVLAEITSIAAVFLILNRWGMFFSSFRDLINGFGDLLPF